MDAVTHALLGMAVAGLSGQQPALDNPVYLAAVLGSQAPDFDIVAIVRGGMAYLRQHRAMSHSLPAVAVWSVLIALGLSPFFPQAAYGDLFLWAFAGGLSHIIIDYFNTHGASLFWPIRKERLSCNLLNVFDPIILTVMLSLYLYPMPMQHLSFATFAAFSIYIAFRVILRYRAAQWLRTYFIDNRVQRIAVMPSLQRFFHWDFVIETTAGFMIGQIGVLYPVIQVRTELPKQNASAITAEAQKTPLGEFFNAFTPFSYFEERKAVDTIQVRIYDLRYYKEEGFLHSATIVFGDNADLKPNEAYVQSYGRKLNYPC